MKRTILAVALSTASALSFAGDSYITGNVQHHSNPDFSGSRATSTIEVGHTFATTERGGLTVLAEIDGIKLGVDTQNSTFHADMLPCYLCRHLCRAPGQLCFSLRFNLCRRRTG
ncbi:hypothetical protein [Endozoicomonas acroporae]|uniref:hypothetical protein n=1 Tax=Endozoicomonas acroporae TaxID=1701104 RepID=UPI003D7B7F77